jgi:hypothetical protein
MGYQYIADSFRFLQLQKEAENEGLNGTVQAGDRFV